MLYLNAVVYMATAEDLLVRMVVSFEYPIFIGSVDTTCNKSK